MVNDWNPPLYMVEINSHYIHNNYNYVILYNTKGSNINNQNIFTTIQAYIMVTENEYNTYYRESFDSPISSPIRWVW
jgi:hypothetical protein